MNSLYLSLSKYIWPISIMMLAIVSVASLIPLPNLPEVPGTDKTHHIIAYALIVLPVCIVKPKHWWVFLLIVFLWSGVIELIQPYVNRYGEWMDLLANFCGILIGVGLSGRVIACKK